VAAKGHYCCSTFSLKYITVQKSTLGVNARTRAPTFAVYMDCSWIDACCTAFSLKHLATPDPNILINVFSGRVSNPRE
jgi:hypothetical protein